MARLRQLLDWDAPLSGAPHFSLRELTRSSTADIYGLYNEPSPAALLRIVRLAREILEPLRRRFGPLAVTSGFRSPELNWHVSLSRRSRHCRGEAADVRPLQGRVRPLDVAAYAYKHLPCHEIILYHPPGGWLHLSMRGLKRPGQRLMLKPRGGKLAPITLGELDRRFGGVLDNKENTA